MELRVIRDAGGNDRAVIEPSMESSSVEVHRKEMRTAPRNTTE